MKLVFKAGRYWRLEADWALGDAGRVRDRDLVLYWRIVELTR